MLNVRQGRKRIVFERQLSKVPEMRKADDRLNLVLAQMQPLDREGEARKHEACQRSLRLHGVGQIQHKQRGGRGEAQMNHVGDTGVSRKEALQERREADVIQGEVGVLSNMEGMQVF